MMPTTTNPASLGWTRGEPKGNTFMEKQHRLLNWLMPVHFLDGGLTGTKPKETHHLRVNPKYKSSIYLSDHLKDGVNTLREDGLPEPSVARRNGIPEGMVVRTKQGLPKILKYGYIQYASTNVLKIDTPTDYLVDIKKRYPAKWLDISKIPGDIYQKDGSIVFGLADDIAGRKVRKRKRDTQSNERPGKKMAPAQQHTPPGVHRHTSLKGYTKTTGNTKFKTFNEAAAACLKDPDAGGITRNSRGVFTVRRGAKGLVKYDPEDSWLRQDLILEVDGTISIVT
tara:strand:- start:131 stop:976 length:846 start_codon:yes stop_codon:yes gene_type:complete